MKSINKVFQLSAIVLGLLGSVSLTIHAGDSNAAAQASAPVDERNLIGAEMGNLTGELRNATGYMSGNGVYVSAVIAGQPAQAGGLMVGDIITEINDIPVEDLSGASDIIKTLNAGQSYPFKIYRRVVGAASPTMTLNITIGQIQVGAVAKTL